MAKFMGRGQKYSSRAVTRLRRYIKIKKTYGDGCKERHQQQ